VPLNAGDAGQDRVGAFVYAGGISLTSQDTARLHGLSDLQAWPDGRFVAQGDQGDQVDGRLRLDARGRLVGVAGVRIRGLKAPDGQELFAKGPRERDAEGFAQFPNRDRLVSFEQDDRILLYPARGGPPREAPRPQIRYVFNKGMEALDTYPAGGADAYIVGIEATGQTFVCKLSAACTPDQTVALSDGFELAALAMLPDGGRAYLLRAFDALRGSRNILRITAPDGAVRDELKLVRPLTVENFEGVAAVPGRGGRVRFYLISDDNFGTYNGLPTGQRTLILAFDWRPQGRTP
jgi:hypothetical protein